MPSGWSAMRARVLREEPTCRRCRAPSVTVDHVVPRYLGGGHQRANLQALCKRCHDAKTAAEGKAANRAAAARRRRRRTR
jgi:5-methylcytosine-specific restriction enzyme A